MHIDLFLLRGAGGSNLSNIKSGDSKIPGVAPKGDRDGKEEDLDEIVITYDDDLEPDLPPEPDVRFSVVKSSEKPDPAEEISAAIDAAIHGYGIPPVGVASGVIDAGEQDLDRAVIHDKPIEDGGSQMFTSEDALPLHIANLLMRKRQLMEPNDGVIRPSETLNWSADSSVYDVVELGKTVEYRIAMFGAGNLMQAAVDYCFAIIGDGDELTVRNDESRISSAKDVRYVRYVKKFIRTDDLKYGDNARDRAKNAKRELGLFGPNFVGIYRNTATSRKGKSLYDMTADELQKHIGMLHAGLRPCGEEPFAMAFMIRGRRPLYLPDYNPSSPEPQILNAYHLAGKIGDKVVLHEMEMDRLVIRLIQEIRRHPERLREI
jgi:hypothetical protein